MSERWTTDQHYARGKADALGEVYEYLLRYGSDALADWLRRRERAFMALLPTDEHGNTQFAPTQPSEAAGTSEGTAG